MKLRPVLGPPTGFGRDQPHPLNIVLRFSFLLADPQALEWSGSWTTGERRPVRSSPRPSCTDLEKLSTTWNPLPFGWAISMRQLNSCRDPARHIAQLDRLVRAQTVQPLSGTGQRPGDAWAAYRPPIFGCFHPTQGRRHCARLTILLRKFHGPTPCRDGRRTPKSAQVAKATKHVEIRRRFCPKRA